LNFRVRSSLEVGALGRAVVAACAPTTALPTTALLTRFYLPSSDGLPVTWTYDVKTIEYSEKYY